jgi:DNA-binding beta-propeller fold protein YncE
MTVWHALGVPRWQLAAIFVFVTCVLSGCQQVASHNAPRQVLYIVDSDRGSFDSHERLFALDPERKQIVRNYATGAHPDIALSPDGARLYVASESRVPEGPEGAGAGRLDVIDTATGAIVASVADPNRWVAMGPLYGSNMALSADGHWLYVYKLAPGPQHTVSEFVAIFDTATNKFLPDAIPLSNCGASLLVPWRNGRALSALCFATEDVRTMQFSDQGIPTTQLPVVIAIPHDFGRTRLGTAFVSGENELTVLMTDGKYHKINVQTGTTVQEGEIAFSPPLTPPGWHPQIPGAEHVPSLGRRNIGSRILESQGRLYVPLSRSDLYMHGADAIAVLDAGTLQQEGFFELKSPWWHSSWNLFRDGAIGDGGRRLYLLGLESKGGTVRVLSLPDGKEIGTINGLGTTLSIIVPSP